MHQFNSQSRKKGGVNLVNQEKEREKVICPKCNSDEVAHILYGYPTPEARKEAKEGNRFELEALHVEELTGELQIELGNLLTDLAESLNLGDSEQSSVILQCTRRALSTVGRQVRLKVIEAYGTGPNPNRTCPDCKAPYVIKETVDYLFIYPGAKLNYICQVCGKTFD